METAGEFGLGLAIAVALGTALYGFLGVLAGPKR
jgi:hypothetical protein